MSRAALRWLGLGALVVLVALITGVGGLSYLEQDDRFCASCHTQPETEFFDRARTAVETQNAPDLASFHRRKKEVKCIDCHVGEGVLGRGTVVSLALWDAFKHYTGIARQPAVIVFPVQNEACVKCHRQEVVKPGFENHMHNKQFDGKDVVPALRCNDCHVTHRLGDERAMFQFRDAILPKCESCHVTVGRGPRGLSK